MSRASLKRRAWFFHAQKQKGRIRIIQNTLAPVERKPDGTLYRMTPAQHREAKKIIRKLCSNFCDGNCTPLCIMVNSALIAGKHPITMPHIVFHLNVVKAVADPLLNFFIRKRVVQNDGDPASFVHVEGRVIAADGQDLVDLRGVHLDVDDFHVPV